jgi:hypothetical protein
MTTVYVLISLLVLWGLVLTAEIFGYQRRISYLEGQIAVILSAPPPDHSDSFEGQVVPNPERGKEL